MTGLPPLKGTLAAGQREGLSPDHRPCNLPFTTLGTLFKGRQEFLADLRKNLVREDRRAVAVHGLGGVGKTRAALEYAWRHDKDYTALLLVSAPTAAELRANLANLAGVLAIESTVTAVDQQVAEVLRWLEAHPGWLLIVDNVDTEDVASEVERLLAKLRAGHVLITSRIANWSAGVEPLELHVLAAADATAFLLERTPHRRRPADDPSAAAAAAHELGCLALALEQAGAYINKLRLSFTEYLGRWRQKRPEVLRWHDERLMQYPASVAITWETTFAQLREPEQRLLQVLAWLAPEPIPLFLFDAQPLSQAIPEPREALAGLAAFSLARFEAAGDAVAVHRLVQEVARSRAAEPDRQTALRTALDTVNAAAVGSPQDVRSWLIWTPLAPHVAAATGHADATGLTGPTSRLMNDLGLYLKIRCQFLEAEPLLRRALAIDEASYGPDHLNVAIRLNNLAALLQDTNRLGEAEPLMRRALVIDEASYGPDHPNVAIDLNNLASLLWATNRLGEAEPLMRRALAIDEASYGPDQPDVAIDLNNLASLLQATNRLGEAEPLMRRALAIDEASYGPDQPDVAIDLNNLASLLQATNRLGEAEPLMRRALAIDEASYGPDHPNVARDLNSLASLLRATNRLGEAEPLMRRALAIDEASYGPDHPTIAIRLNNLASLLRATNRLGEAEPLMRRALAIDEASYGPDHPRVATDLNNLAQLLQDTNRLGEAEPLSRRCLEILLGFTRSTGREHPHLRAVIENYRGLLQVMGQGEAEIQTRLEEIGHPFGLRPGAGPSAENAPSPG